jgi:hypothetical protein
MAIANVKKGDLSRPSLRERGKPVSQDCFANVCSASGTLRMIQK